MAGKSPVHAMVNNAIQQHPWPENLRHGQWATLPLGNINVRKISGMGNDQHCHYAASMPENFRHGQWAMLPLCSIGVRKNSGMGNCHVASTAGKSPAQRMANNTI